MVDVLNICHDHLCVCEGVGCIRYLLYDHSCVYVGCRCLGYLSYDHLCVCVGGGCLRYLSYDHLCVCLGGGCLRFQSYEHLYVRVGSGCLRYLLYDQFFVFQVPYDSYIYHVTRCVFICSAIPQIFMFVTNCTFSMLAGSPFTCDQLNVFIYDHIYVFTCASCMFYRWCMTQISAMSFWMTNIPRKS